MAKTKTIENLFVYLAIYSPFIPIICFLIYWKKSKLHTDIWVIFWYCLLIDFTINYIMGFVLHTALKTILYAAFTFFEYLLFVVFLYLNLKKAKAKNALLITSLCFFIFIVIYFLTVKLKGIDSVPIGVETILILIFSFYFLFEQMNDTTNLFIYSKYGFWIIMGMLIYLAGSFFIYIFSAQLLAEHKNNEVAKYWMFTNVFSILKNLLFSIGIILNGRQIPVKNNHFTMYNLN